MNHEFSSPFGFHAGRKRKGTQLKPNEPQPYAADCPVEQREEALAALAKMHRERPLRPPGK